MLNIDDRLIKDVSPKIKPNALSVLLAIAIHLNQKTNRCFPSHHRLMQLTGMGRDAVYKALSTLQKEGLLKSEQRINSAKKTFSNRVFRVSTRFIQVFVSAEDMEPLPENPYTENPYTENPYTENPETEQINEGEQINESQQINEGERVAHAQNENDPNPLTPPPVAAAPPTGPSLRDYPKAGTDTPTKLLSELRRLYAANPEEWRATIDGTPAMNWPDKKRSEVIAKFCDHAIFSGWENRQFKQINARLKQWLRDEQYMDRQKQATPQSTPQGPAYKPFSH